VISLKDFVARMLLLSDECHVYLNKTTGDLISVDDRDVALAESDEANEFMEWQDASVQEAKRILLSDEYLEIPCKYDIHEYRIMERFSQSFPDERIRGVLLEKIRGAGAFRRFKEAIIHYNIDKDWYKFRDQAHKEIAITWLNKHGITYNDDLN
jgi:hypothetical protein